jgi:hypothetical protein
MSDPALTPANEPAEPPYRGAIGELERLQAEIDDDLTAGRISPEAYQSANGRIASALQAATEPLPPGQKIRAVGIPRKEIDTEQLAMVYWMQAKRLAREKREAGERDGSAQ